MKKTRVEVSRQTIAALEKNKYNLGVIIYIVLNLFDLINGAILEEILLYFVVSLGIFGVLYSSWKKRI